MSNIDFRHQMDERLKRYEGVASKVPGWMPPRFVRVVSAVNAVQTTLGIKGDVAEIGVHHGRLFSALTMIRRPDEIAYALDCFDNWAANPERSGGCPRARFVEGMEIAGVRDLDRVQIIECDTNADPHPIERVRGPLRIVSVDGDHTAKGVERDLWRSLLGTSYGGVVLADDAFNEEWPAVSEGLHAFLRRGTLVGALSGFGKIILAEPFMAKALQEVCLSCPSFGLVAVRKQNFYGHEIIAIQAR